MVAHNGVVHNYREVGEQFGLKKTAVDSQMIFSPGPIIFELRRLLKTYRPSDYLLLTGDPPIIGGSCSVVSDITHGKYNLLKWDRQERMYYPISINLYEKGQVDE